MSSSNENYSSVEKYNLDLNKGGFKKELIDKNSSFSAGGCTFDGIEDKSVIYKPNKLPQTIKA